MFIRVLIIVSFAVVINASDVIHRKEYINNYDVVDFQILKVRNKHAALSTFESTPKTTIDLEVQFTSFGKNFHMILFADQLFQEVSVESYSYDILTRNFSPRAEFYEGYLRDNELDSTIFGFFLDGLFTGKITNANETYFIEPASLFFENTHFNSKKIVVYRDIDIHPHLSHVFPSYPSNFSEWRVLYRSPNISVNFTVENSGLDVSNETEDLFCEVEIVADHTLYDFFQKDIDRLSAMLYFHCKFADYVFRRADFNMDGDPDGIRIAVGKIFIYKSDKDGNYPMLQASSLSDYLSSFVLRKQKSRFCLSVAMIYRDYDGSAVGEAFKAESFVTGAVGGICDPPMPNYMGTSPLHFNTGVINMQYKKGPLPSAITMIAFTHEIAHGFGSAHDPLKDLICSPGNYSNYLMYPVSSYGSINAMKFSPCSRAAVSEILLYKGSCLKSRNPLCGNGIREADEECDCGKEKFCDLIDPCCTPSDAQPPEEGCTIRSRKGFKCSPKESECCDKSCSIVKSKKYLCHSNEVRCLYSFCDGQSAACPKPKAIPELCPLKFTCDNTTCTNITVCSSQGLKDCLCLSSLTTQCLQCCQKGNTCVPASELGVLNSDGKPYILQPGMSCNDDKYECDKWGNCITNIHWKNNSMELYTSVTVICFLVAVLVLLAIGVSCKGNIGSDAIPITDIT